MKGAHKSLISHKNLIVTAIDATGAAAEEFDGGAAARGERSLLFDDAELTGPFGQMRNEKVARDRLCMEFQVGCDQRGQEGVEDFLKS